ncbi:hypothetical protein [Halobacterium bonnevillei]|uniref:DUF8055 domain-containing protein n=1 Tax=Halobacterium bonnevillei TaxID=2692200 RepID=A0A6B0SGV6_9EURY|nr:hypothetical protein [Halobacterium bonnevillei]MXR20838.1 hypothetical protein [Halobacterium bonnevillei]
MTERSRYWERIKPLADRARRDCEHFERPEEPPDEQQALEYLREGVGPAISIYVEGRTGGQRVPFTDVELSLLEQSMNNWLSLYAQCYGKELDAAFSIREAAEVLLDTRNVADTARVLTHIPERGVRDPQPSGKE